MHLNLMKNRLKMLTIAMAMCLALSFAVAPALAAAPNYTVTDGNGYIRFVGVDGTAPYNYTIYVGTPYAVGLDADYWNFTIYSDYVGTATNTSYYVHVHIYDGATNLTKNVTLAAKNDVRVYSNASHATGAIVTMVANSSAVIYIELLLGGTGTVEQHWTGEIGIYEHELTSGLLNALMLIIPMIILVMIIGWVGNLTGKIGGKSRRK